MPEMVKIEEIAANLKQYANTNIELLKLEAAERSSALGSGFISGLLVTLVGILFLLFLSLAAAFYISTSIGDNYSGFMIIAGFYFLVCLILLIGRRKLLEKPLRDKLIRKMFSSN